MSKKLQRTTLFYFKCDGCGKEGNFTVYDRGGEEQQILENYKRIAAEFTKLGYPANVRCFCDICADKYYHDVIFHNIVFSVKRPDRNDPVISYPEKKEFIDANYRTTLAFLKGADTIKKLSVATNTQLSAMQYLEHVYSVLVNGKC